MEELLQTAEPTETLRQYGRLKTEIVSVVQTAFHLLDRERDHDAKRACQDLLARLAEDRFVLAVVGQFSRGKSSLMNAVLGMDWLPVGIVPLTSAITKVFYGNPERVTIELEGTSLRPEIKLSQLPDYVTEHGNPGNVKKVVAAEVQLPADVLRYGFYFVDTPGIGSAIAANTQTTERFLPEADAVIFVTSFESPLAEGEIQFLKKVREHVRKIFWIINKSDLVPAPERDHVLRFVRSVLNVELGLSDPPLFAVSAQAGLRAKLDRSGRDLAESGLAPLEESLVQFLTHEKSVESLARVCDRTLELLAEVQAGADVPEKDVPKFQELITRAIQIRGQLLGREEISEQKTTRTQLKESVSVAELMRAVRKPCPVCVRVADAMMKFLAGLQYRLVIDESERVANARRGGLCPLHTWQYSEIASPQGISMSYPPVLRALSQKLQELAESDSLSPATRMGSLVARPDVCRVCQEQAKVQDQTLNDTLQSMSEGADKSQLPALCLPHLNALLRKSPTASIRASLLAFEAALLDRLAENMERYGLKHDALRRGFATEDERVAYHRGLAYLVGDKRLSFPWHVEHVI